MGKRAIGAVTSPGMSLDDQNAFEAAGIIPPVVRPG
jgi:hypothetical protein